MAIVLGSFVVLLLALWCIQFITFSVLFRAGSTPTVHKILGLGVLVHESWHLVTGLIIFQPIKTKMNVFEPHSRALGDVQFHYHKSAFKTLFAPIVSFAPLVGGVFMIMLMIRLTTGMPLEQMWSNPIVVAEQLIQSLDALPLWLACIIVYIQASIAVCMFPSRQDFIVALPGTLLWGIIIVLAISGSWLASVPVLMWVTTGLTYCNIILEIAVYLSLIGCICTIITAIIMNLLGD